ncbi:MAG: hypothetical protein EBQ92_06130 [Proteobacteria bacterium]|nr:hypothetical protein [Pseudomonadota bacterium]
MKKLLTVCLLVSAFAVQTANAEFGGVPGIGGGDKKGGGDAGKDIKSFLEKAKKAEGLMSKTISSLVGVIVSTKEMGAIKAAIKAQNSKISPRELDAKSILEGQSKLEEKVSTPAQEAAISKLSAKKKEALGNAIHNFILAGLKDKELVENGKDIVSSVSSNPMEAAKMAGQLGSVKDTISSLTSQMEKAVGITPKLVEWAKANNITPSIPSSSSEEVKPADIP